MRKSLFLLGVLLLPLFMTKAQDTPIQPPITAQFKDKLYAVSSEDGSSRILVELSPGNVFTWQAIQLSPDGTKLIYATQAADPNSSEESITSLFILDLASGTSTDLQARGGVFDRKPPNHTFSLAYFTWLFDGSRVYYNRMEFDRAHNMVQVQLVYYDMAAQTYHLVERSDPKRSVPVLKAVESGVMAHWSNDQFWGLYTPDNKMVKSLVGLYGYLIQYEGQDYLATNDNKGYIASITHVKTSEKKVLGEGYYPATRSRLAGDQSLVAVFTQGSSGTYYRIFDSDQTTVVKVLEAETRGVVATLSPDGRFVAYLQFDEFGYALIRVVNDEGSTWELPVLAESIFWGPTESLVFHEPAGG